MSYSRNWVRHLFAVPNGECWSKVLARDFSWGDEDIWERGKRIKWHLLKLFWVYSMSVLTQITLPSVFIIGIASLFKKIPLVGWIFGVSAGSAVGLFFATLR